MILNFAVKVFKFSSFQKYKIKAQRCLSITARKEGNKKGKRYRRDGAKAPGLNLFNVRKIRLSFELSSLNTNTRIPDTGIELSVLRILSDYF